MNWSIVRCLAALVLVAAGSGCGGGGQASPETVRSFQHQLTPPARPDYVERGEGGGLWKAEKELYERRSYQPVWLDGARPRPEVEELRTAIEAVRADGLDPADYTLPDLAPLRAASSRNPFERAAVESDPVVAADLHLTHTFLKLAAHLVTGRVNPATVDPHWFGQPRQSDPGAVLERAFGGAGVAATLRGLVPQHEQYRLLKDALRRSRETEAPSAQVAQQIRRIELNLERWRWLPESLGDRYILVNVPTFTLSAVEGGQATLVMRVVAGEADSPTPIFSDQMTTVVFSPYWNIPETIAREETIPALLRDPDYLRKNDLEVVRGTRVIDAGSVDWMDPDVRIRQRPGARNSLGRVKFMFPNQFDVYLHDTPADALFERARRDFSHGCVRVERPFALAQWVLSGQTEWTPEKIEAAMNAGDERHVALARKVPVYIVYQTVWVEADGSVRFVDDVYGHDARQLRLLKPSAPPVPPQRVARR
jgi:murein L,D-transpeptidase YcbB/YkuD